MTAKKFNYDSPRQGPQQSTNGVSSSCTSLPASRCSLQPVQHLVSFTSGRQNIGRLEPAVWELQPEEAVERTYRHFALRVCPPQCQPTPTIIRQKCKSSGVSTRSLQPTPTSLCCYFSVSANGFKCFSRCKLNIKRHMHVKSLVRLLYKE